MHGSDMNVCSGRTIDDGIYKGWVKTTRTLIEGLTIIDLGRVCIQLRILLPHKILRLLNLLQPAQQLKMSILSFRKLQGKHVLIIGGTSGIGRAVAEGAAASGAVVTISSSRQSKVESTVKDLKAAYPISTIVGFACDLGNADTAEANLDVLFISASSARPVDHVVFTAADALSLGSLDTVTPVLITQASHMRFVVPVLVGKVAARYLPKSTSSSIILTGGSVAQKPDPGWAVVAYFAGGLVSLAQALALDLKPIRVNAVQPGYVDTGLWGEQRENMKELVEGKMPTGKFAAVEDVAEAYLWLMKDANTTGTVARTDSGCFLV
jgi:NAD(P)-dependent dehydrogenase (short-subunit alcohol dehydrogenase family)